MITHVIPESIRGMKLSKYIARAYAMLPEYALRDAFKRRDIKLNGVRVKPDVEVFGGEELVMYIHPRYTDASLETLYDDGCLFACVKPQGLPVDVDADGIGADTLINRIRHIHPAAQLAHRLDAQTGGVILAALTPEALEKALDAFRKHEVRKTYKAIVSGAAHACVYSDHLIKDAKTASVSIVKSPVAGSKPIVTRCELVSSLSDGLSYVELEPVTGRTHQLRAHMAYHAHPILGDDKYGDRALNKLLSAGKLCLWCEALEYAGKRFYSPAPNWLSR